MFNTIPQATSIPPCRFPICSESNLGLVFSELGFVDEDSRAALVQLLAATGCLGDVEQISKEEALVRLDGELAFSSPKEAMEWLVDVTQDKWLRASQNKEALKARDNSVNFSRWFEQDSLDEQTKAFLVDCLERVGLTKGAPWPVDSAPHDVLLMGGLEKPHVIERLEALKLVPRQQTPEVCYLSGPRGVFNYEPSLAPVLANQWFGDASLEPRIQKVLDAHSKAGWPDRMAQMKLLILSELGYIDEKRTREVVEEMDAALAQHTLKPHDWFENALATMNAVSEEALEESKKQKSPSKEWYADALGKVGDLVGLSSKVPEILEGYPKDKDWYRAAIATISSRNDDLFRYWPEGKGFYHQDPDLYGEESHNWPVAADMVKWRLEHTPGLPQAKVIPIIAQGKNGRLANTGDTVEEWDKVRGGALKAHAPATIALLSSQPHVAYMHATTEGLLDPARFRPITIGVEYANPNIKQSLDVFARLFYTKKAQLINRW